MWLGNVIFIFIKLSVTKKLFWLCVDFILCAFVLIMYSFACKAEKCDLVWGDIFEDVNVRFEQADSYRSRGSGHQCLFSVSYVHSHLYLEPHPLIGSLRVDANTRSKQALCLQSSQQRQRMNGWVDRWMVKASRMRSAVWASYIRLADHLMSCKNSKELLSVSHAQGCFISVLEDEVACVCFVTVVVWTDFFLKPKLWFLKTFQPVLTASQDFQDSKPCLHQN